LGNLQGHEHGFLDQYPEQFADDITEFLDR
jgi:hypothetical protein